MLNNQKIPRARLIAESLAIVGSILVAFAVDAWWQDREERQEERRYVTSLRQEFVSGLEYLDEREAVHLEIKTAHEQLIRVSQGADRPSDDSLYYLFSLLSRPTTVSVPRAVFDDLISSGGTQLIQSDELRIALAAFAVRLNIIERYDAAAWITWEQRIQPYLEGRVPRVNRLIQGSFGRASRSRGFEFPFGMEQNDVDFDSVLGDAGFQDMIAERWFRVRTLLVNVRDLQVFMQETIQIIDRELDDN